MKQLSGGSAPCKLVHRLHLKAAIPLNVLGRQSRGAVDLLRGLGLAKVRRADRSYPREAEDTAAEPHGQKSHRLQVHCSRVTSRTVLLGGWSRKPAGTLHVVNTKA